MGRERRAVALERGAATVVAVALTGVLLLIGAAAGVVGAIVVAHRRAQAAADLAALAGAAVVQQNRDPCAVAAQTARANGAEIASCEVVERDVVVEVVVTGPRWLGQDEDLTARARAGPVAAGGR